MSKKGDNPSQERDLGIDEEQLDTGQEGVPVPLFAGERRIVVRWVCVPTIDRTEPVDMGGKK